MAIAVGDAMSQMRKLSFDGFEIPYKKITIEGGGRDHEHQYPHTAGAANEKLGRELYRITVDAHFADNLIDQKYAALYPGRLNTLLMVFERQDTATLVLPNRGEIQAYCTNWTTTLDARIRSGEDVVLKFKEDRNAEIVASQGIVLQRRDLTSAYYALAAQEENLNRDIFTAITDAFNGVMAYLDQADMYGALLSAKLEGFLRMLRTADETLDELNDPANWLMLENLHALWEQVQNVADDVLDMGMQLHTYVVPTDCTVTELATTLYGDASMANELTGLNYFEDPLLIPAATEVKYYAETAPLANAV